MSSAALNILTHTTASILNHCTQHLLHCVWDTLTNVQLWTFSSEVCQHRPRLWCSPIRKDIRGCQITRPRRPEEKREKNIDNDPILCWTNDQQPQLRWHFAASFSLISKLSALVRHCIAKKRTAYNERPLIIFLIQGISNNSLFTTFGIPDTRLLYLGREQYKAKRLH